MPWKYSISRYCLSVEMALRQYQERLSHFYSSKVIFLLNLYIRVFLSPDAGVILPSWSVSQLRPAVPCAPAHLPPGVLSCAAHTSHASAHTAVRSVWTFCYATVLCCSCCKKNNSSILCPPGKRLILNYLSPALSCQIKYARTKIELFLFFLGKPWHIYPSVSFIWGLSRSIMCLYS